MDDFFVPPPQQVLVTEPGEPATVKVTAVGEPVRGIGSFYDVTRLRVEGLEPLRVGHEAVFHAFDWDLGAVAGSETRVEPSDLVLLEGVYSGAPELRDLVDRAIYVDTPETERLRRIAAASPRRNGTNSGCGPKSSTLPVRARWSHLIS